MTALARTRAAHDEREHELESTRNTIYAELRERERERAGESSGKTNKGDRAQNGLWHRNI